MQYGNWHQNEELARMRYEDARREAESDALLSRSGLDLWRLLWNAIAGQRKPRPVVAIKALETCTPEKQEAARRAAA